MNRRHIAALLFAALAASSAQAQLELADGKIWVTAEERLRVEYRRNNTFFDSSISADEDWFLLQRARLGLGAKPVDWFKIYGELQDAREVDSRRDPNVEEGYLDLRQAWLSLANHKEFPLGMKFGRQELSYGDERLIGAFAWNNVGRVFDAAKVRYERETVWVDFFAANVVINSRPAGNGGTFDDEADWADDFFGAYGRFAVFEKHALEAYALYRDKDDAEFNGPTREHVTIGGRFETNAKMAPWDYFVEAAGQFGTFADADHSAFAGVIGTGYTLAGCPAVPRIGFEYNYATGDNDPTDDDSHTFDNLYPTNHKFYGYMDLFAWKNIHNPRLTVSCKPHDQVKVQLDGHMFWLANNADAWYRANGAAIRADPAGDASSYVGSEVDLTVTYTPHKRVNIQAGYSHFFAGDFVEETGTHSDADFFYTQVTLKL
jgi:hypothetical protein